MDSSIDSDHSWESHSTGSSGRGTQHSDQGSLGSVTQRAAVLLHSGHDEVDGNQFVSIRNATATAHSLLTTFVLFALVGRLDVAFSSVSSHRVSQCDENRVKIQVPSASSCPPLWNQTAGPASIASVESSSSSSSASSRGVVTVLEGPQSGTTLVESLSTEPVKVSSPTRTSFALLTSLRH